MREEKILVIAGYDLQQIKGMEPFLMLIETFLAKLILYFI